MLIRSSAIIDGPHESQHCQLKSC